MPPLSTLPAASPEHFRMQRRVADDLVAGAALANGVAKSAIVVLADVERVRLRFTATCAGSYVTEFLRPDALTAYVNGKTTSVVLANTEKKVDIDPLFGIGLVKVTFTPTADGVVSLHDVCGTPAVTP